MPYRKQDLAKNTFPLVYETPPASFLDKEWRRWREDRHKNPERWLAALELYDFFHVNPKDPIANRSCSMCNVAFLTEGWRSIHLNSHAHQVTRAKVKGLPIPEDPLFCKTCNFRAFSHRKMEAHKNLYAHQRNIAIENGLPPPTNDRYCGVCDLDLSTAQAFKKHLTSARHLQRVDKGLYSCVACDKAFATKQSLQTHLNSKKHKTIVGKVCIPVTKYECNMCDNSCFSSKQALQVHCGSKKHLARVRKVDTPIVHQCDTCERIYKNRRQLLKHRRKKHPIVGRV